MKKLIFAVWLLLFSLSGQLAFAQEDSEREDPPSEQAQSAEQEQAAETSSDEQDRIGNDSPESPADISRAFEDFVPSAQVSEDLSVSFPVDI